jgi:hypothetical protein
MTVPVVLLDVNPVITKTTDSLLILFNAFLASGGASMTACGRFLPSISDVSEPSECLLLVKAEMRLCQESAYRSEAAVRLLNCVRAATDPLQTSLVLRSIRIVRAIKAA